MIISKTPYRVSFFGGGSDYRSWYARHGGAVLSTTINHACYLTVRYLPPFLPEKTRIVWSMIEQVNNHADIQHPAVRAVLKHFGIETGVEIHHMGDLPARSGLGSSSAFTVGLLNAMHALQGRMSSKRDLAAAAIHIERDVLKENVGVQDQIATAYGGLNHIAIETTGECAVKPVILPPERMDELQSHFLLFFTGVSRTASDIAAEQMKVHASGDKDSELKSMQEMVGEALAILASGRDIADFGHLLHESWRIKRSLAKNIAPPFVDDIYARALSAGAVGGKLLGAGGGGFMLFFARPEDHPFIKEELQELLWVPFKFENTGSSIIFYEPNAYSRTSLTKRDYKVFNSGR